MVDILTFGETMLRLSPPADQRLETARQFDVHVGGAESNVAVAASRLGRSTVWVSKLPDSPLGRNVADELRRAGVEPAVTWSESGRVGTYYLESGDPPRGTDVIYDRAGSAVTTATPDELATDRLTGANIVHTTGITPALSPTLAETAGELLSRAADGDPLVSFDLNYRSKLWSPSEARKTIEPLLADVDLLFVPLRDAEDVLEIDGDPAEVAGTLSERFDVETVVVTMGSDGAIAYQNGTSKEQPPYPASDRRPIGTGDAFVGGFLAQFVDGDDLETALAWGSATAALKRSIPGDTAIVTPAEVEAVIDGASPDISR